MNFNKYFKGLQAGTCGLWETHEDCMKNECGCRFKSNECLKWECGVQDTQKEVFEEICEGE